MSKYFRKRGLFKKALIVRFFFLGVGLDQLTPNYYIKHEKHLYQTYE